MTLTGTQKALTRSGVRLFWAVATLLAIRAATYSGVSLFELYERSGFRGLFGDGLDAPWRAVAGLVRLNPVVGAVLLPALLVAGLLLAGLYLSRRRAG